MPDNPWVLNGDLLPVVRLVGLGGPFRLLEIHMLFSADDTLHPGSQRSDDLVPSRYALRVGEIDVLVISAPATHLRACPTCFGRPPHGSWTSTAANCGRSRTRHEQNTVEVRRADSFRRRCRPITGELIGTMDSLTLARIQFGLPCSAATRAGRPQASASP